MRYQFGNKKLTAREFLMYALELRTAPGDHEIVYELPINTARYSILRRDATAICCRIWLGIEPQPSESVASFLARAEQSWGNPERTMRIVRPSKSA